MRGPFVFGVLFAGLAVLLHQAARGQATNANPSVPESVALDPDLLSKIMLQGSWKNATSEEIDIYYEVLNHVRTVEDDALKAAARELIAKRRAASPKFQKALKRDPEREFWTFVDLFHNPKLYHGKPVTFKGHARQYRWMPADENKHGFQKLHELSLFTDDSQTNPIIVVCTSLPEGFPTREDLINNVSVTGYFFKMLAYDAHDAARIAPLIVAHRIEWRPTDDSSLMGPVHIAVYAAAVVLIVLMIFFSIRAGRIDRIQRSRRLASDSDSAEPDFSNLAAAADTGGIESAIAESADESDPQQANVGEQPPVANDSAPSTSTDQPPA